MSVAMHRKRNRLLYYTYYCPVKGITKRMRVDAIGGCPLCGATFEWSEAPSA